MVTRDGPALTAASPTSGGPDRPEHAASTMRTGVPGASAEPATAVPPTNGAAPGDEPIARAEVAPTPSATPSDEPSHKAAPSGAPAALPILTHSKPSPTSPVVSPSAKMVDVAIDSIPAGAEVLIGDDVLGRTPFRGKIRHGDGDVTFVIRMSGYAQRQLVTRADKRISQRVALVSLAWPVSPSNRDESVNPFTE